MAKKKIKFEDALKRLEEISEALENDETTLDEMIALYEEGTELAKFCYDELRKAELKIEKLSKETEVASEENKEENNELF